MDVFAVSALFLDVNDIITLALTSRSHRRELVTPDGRRYRVTALQVDCFETRLTHVMHCVAVDAIDSVTVHGSTRDVGDSLCFLAGILASGVPCAWSKITFTEEEVQRDGLFDEEEKDSETAALCEHLGVFCQAVLRNDLWNINLRSVRLGLLSDIAHDDAAMQARYLMGQHGWQWTFQRLEGCTWVHMTKIVVFPGARITVRPRQTRLSKTYAPTPLHLVPVLKQFDSDLDTLSDRILRLHALENADGVPERIFEQRRQVWIAVDYATVRLTEVLTEPACPVWLQNILERIGSMLGTTCSGDRLRNISTDRMLEIQMRCAKLSMPIKRFLAQRCSNGVGGITSQPEPEPSTATLAITTHTLERANRCRARAQRLSELMGSVNDADIDCVIHLNELFDKAEQLLMVTHLEAQRTLDKHTTPEARSCSVHEHVRLQSDSADGNSSRDLASVNNELDEEHKQLQAAMQESTSEALARENAGIEEALLRRKFETNPLEIVVLRLSRCGKAVKHAILNFPTLLSTIRNVEHAGYEVTPQWANGAILLTPISQEDWCKTSGDFSLRAHHVVVAKTQQDDVGQALRTLRYRERPKIWEVMLESEPLLNKECADSSHDIIEMTKRVSGASNDVDEFHIEVMRTFIHVSTSMSTDSSSERAKTV